MTNNFDFLVGTWTTEHHRRIPFSGEDWRTFTGNSRSWNVFGGTGNLDEVECRTEGFTGLTLRLYNAERDEWSLYWATDRGGLTLPPVVGRFNDDGIGVFTGDDVLDGRPISVVYTWSDITDTSARWEQAFSLDQGTTWETNWTMQFTRTS